MTIRLHRTRPDFNRYDAFSDIAPSQVTAKTCFEMDQNTRVNPHGPQPYNFEYGSLREL